MDPGKKKLILLLHTLYLLEDMNEDKRVEELLLVIE